MSVSNWRFGLVAGCFFIALALCIIPYPGVQSDEALFTVPLYSHVDNHLRPAFPTQLMLIGYIGSLKTLLYWPILRIFGPGIWTLRLPVACIGALSIVFFWRLTSASLGRGPAILSAFLLATDPVFLLTGTVDWGPVAIEHLMLVTGCWLLFHFGSQPPSARPRWELLSGFFCFGLALWNKAVFIWALTGLIAAVLVVFWREVRANFSRRNLTIAAGGFLLGVSPLLVYNLRHANATLNGTARLDPFSLPSKLGQLAGALNGNALFGFMVSDEDSTNPKPGTTVPVWIREHAGEHQRTGFLYVCGVLLLVFPWWWRSRAARFSLVFMAVAWIAMAVTHDAGTGAHHVILLWPFPILFAVSALASLPWRPLVAVAGSGMVLMNLLVVNQYLAQLERNGPPRSFTDAIFSLPAIVTGQPEANVYAADWGISEGVNFLSGGRLNVQRLDSTQNVHQGLFIGHVVGQEFFPNPPTLSYRKVLLQTVADSNGRPVFEVYRLVSESFQ